MSNFSNDISLPFLSPQRIEEIADEFRINNWGTSIPVNVDSIVEAKLNMDLRPYSGLKRLTGIDAFLSADLSYILYDLDQIEARIRFSISHEVGHFVLHSEQIKHLRPASIEEWKDFILNMPDTILSKAETQANMFASYLLIPTNNLIESLEDIKGNIKDALKIIGDDYETLIDFLTPQLSTKFFVARKAMHFRLKNFENKFKEIFK